MREGKVTIILVENPTQGLQLLQQTRKAYGDIYDIGYIGKGMPTGKDPMTT
jgi:hypothetical protein